MLGRDVLQKAETYAEWYKFKERASETMLAQSFSIRIFEQEKLWMSPGGTKVYKQSVEP